jgi:hypothetical protein
MLGMCFMWRGNRVIRKEEQTLREFSIKSTEEDLV